MEDLSIKLNIENVKNIKKFEYDFIFRRGIYALVGENAVGKSTVMSAIASTVYPRTLLRMGSTEVKSDSRIESICKNEKDVWTYNDITKEMKYNHTRVVFNGIYEGSIFSGTRFEDMKNIDKLVQEIPGFANEFIHASTDLKYALSYILHNEDGHYNELYKLKTMDIARKYELNNMPYFLKLEDGQYISKYKMSSGECMLISLLNFINSYALKPQKLRGSRFRKKVIDDRLFVFIDEVELALHPSSIIRLVEYLERMITTTNLTVLFSTHSGELIRKIKPDNIFYLENDCGNARLVSPCYPQFAIRSLYDHDGYDSTILVEDKLSEIIVRRLIYDFRIKSNLLINVLPIGSWNNTLAFQSRAIEQNAFGRDKFLFSIIDGDVKQQVNKCEQFTNLKKLFLPIKSVEKYLYQKLIVENDKSFIRIIGNKYFTLQPLDTIVKEFILAGEGKQDESGKTLFRHLLFHLSKVSVSENEFVKSFCDDLFEYENFGKLRENIEKFITDNFYLQRSKAI